MRRKTVPSPTLSAEKTSDDIKMCFPYRYGLAHVMALHALIGREVPITAPRMSERDVAHDANTYSTRKVKRA